MDPVDVLVIGAGAAGLLAAARAAELGRKVVLLEKNRRPGVKILMSGGTRCNLTHATDAQGIVAAFGKPGRFLHSALAALSPQDLVDLIEAEGVGTKVEPTGKIFPVSNRAADVLDALLRRLTRSGAELRLAEPVRTVRRECDLFQVTTAERTWSARRVIVTTGGQSYPASGTSGDGYAWAETLGHQLVPRRPALTPVTTDAAWVRDLMGLTLADVRVRVTDGDTILDERRGGFLFAHFGLTGPAVLDVSRAVSSHPQPARLVLRCDFLPDMRAELLLAAIQEQAGRDGRRQIAALIAEATLQTVELPRRLIESLVRQAEVSVDRRGAELTREERSRLVGILKDTTVPITGTLGFQKAEVTAGGVALDEIDSRTMHSRRTPGLYFAGEILDLDGPIGGYNFQAAFSTGWLAGQSAAGAAN